MLGFEKVPKGKRLKYFKDYYLISTIGLIIIILMVVNILKVTVFREKDDLNVLVTAAKSDFSDEQYALLEQKFIENFDIDFNENGNEKLVINDCILLDNEQSAGFESAEQDMAATLKLSSVLEVSLCTIQIVDEDMYGLLLGEEMIETYENLAEFGIKGEGYIKIPLEQTKLALGMQDPLYITVRPKDSTRIDPEIYKQHIELVKQIIEK